MRLRKDRQPGGKAGNTSEVKIVEVENITVFTLVEKAVFIIRVTWVADCLASHSSSWSSSSVILTISAVYYTSQRADLDKQTALGFQNRYPKETFHSEDVDTANHRVIDHSG